MTISQLFLYAADALDSIATFCGAIILLNILWKTIKLSKAFCKRLKYYLTK